MIPRTLYHWLNNLGDQPLTKLEKKNKDEISIVTIVFRKRDTAPFYQFCRRVLFILFADQI